jgi:ribonuclease VapC
MMVVDASALAAIFFIEPDAPRFLRTLQETPYACMSAANFLEIAIVIDNRNEPEQMVDLDLFLAEAAVEVVPVTAGQARIARDAYRRFGKGNHPAGLNFGDCFAYALAKERDLPLLFQGADFALTDLRPAR